MKLGKFLFIIILFVALPLLYFWVDAWFISEPPLAEYDLNIDKDGINDLLDSFEEITSLDLWNLWIPCPTQCGRKDCGHNNIIFNLKSILILC